MTETSITAAARGPNLSRRSALLAGSAFALSLALSRRPALAASEVDAFKMQTVLGPIEGAAVKKALAHEHMYVDFFGPNDPNYMNVDWDAALGTCVNRGMELASLDINLIIEWTNIGVGRNVLLLRDVSRRTGLNIVSPTGIYKSLIPPSFAGLNADQIAQRFIDDLSKGVDETPIRSGFIKIATTEDGPTETDTMIHRAAAIAGRETGSTISLHSPHYAATKTVIATLQSEKFDFKRFVWGHAQPSKLDEHKEVASMGATIQYDAIGARSDPFFHGPTDDKSMLDRVEGMIKAGYDKQVLVSADASTFVNPQKWQYDRDSLYVHRYFEPQLTERLGAALSAQILRDNIIRAFRAPDKVA